MKNFDLDVFPIRLIGVDRQEEVNCLVDKILKAYRNNCNEQPKVFDYERQINELVYSFYGLNKKEIELAENFVKKE